MILTLKRKSQIDGKGTSFWEYSIKIDIDMQLVFFLAALKADWIECNTIPKTVMDCSKLYLIVFVHIYLPTAKTSLCPTPFDFSQKIIRSSHIVEINIKIRFHHWKPVHSTLSSGGSVVELCNRIQPWPDWCTIDCISVALHYSKDLFPELLIQFRVCSNNCF